MNKLLQMWFDSSLTGIAFVKPRRRGKKTTFHYQLVNTRFAELLGETPTAFYQQPIGTLLPFSAENEFSQQILAVLQTGISETCHYYQPEANRWLLLTLTRLHKQVVVNLEETSGPTQAKAGSALFESDLLLQTVIDSSPIALALLRPIYENGRLVDFRYLISNPRNARLTGFSQQAMVHQSVLSLFPHLLTNGVFSRLTEVALTGTAQHFELRDNLEPGPFWGSFSLLRVGNDVLLSIQDVTHLRGVEGELLQTNLELEQRVAERTAQVQQLSALQRAILTHTGLAIAATDTRGVIQLVNPALESLTGYKAAELIGNVTPGVLREPSIHHTQVEQLKSSIDDVSLIGEDIITAYVTKHKFLRRENTLLTKEGKHIPVLSTVSGLYDDQGTLMGFVDIATDITHLKTIEEALVQAQQRNQLAIKAGKLGIWEWNLLTDEMALDADFFAYLNLPDQRSFRRIEDALTLVHPDDLAYVEQALQAVREGEASFNIEFRVVIPTTRSIHFLKVDGLRLDSSCGSIQRLVGMVADGTTQRQAQQALLESEQRFRQIAENVDEIFWIRDIQESRFLYVNTAFTQLTGIPLENLYENHLAFIGAIVEEDLGIIQAALTGNNSHNTFKFRIYHPGGGIRWLRARTFIVKDEAGNCTRRVGIATDITTAIEKEQILEESLAKERNLNALKSQFIATASHEFRTPLMSITSSIELVKYYANLNVPYPTSPLINKHSDMILKQVMSLNELIADTLTISQIDEGKIQVQLESTDLVAFTEELITLNFGNQQDNRQVELAVAGAGYAVPIFIDKKLMTHVLSNLLSNAFKFSSVNPRLTISFSPNAVTIAISDQGLGIPKTDLPNLFRKFFRASNVNHIKGTGLGLAICQEYLSLQQGLIEVDSLEGVGTTFTITLRPPNLTT